jgi:hypothetical protein
MDATAAQCAGHSADAGSQRSVAQAAQVVYESQLIGALRIALQQVLRKIEVGAARTHRGGV